MTKYPCPICGEPNGFPIWIDAEPPGGCPCDPAWHTGARSINSVSECSYQRRKAWLEAERRRLSPDSFDENGNMKPGQSGIVLQRFISEHPDEPPIEVIGIRG